MISGTQWQAIGWWALLLTGLSVCLYSMAVDPLSQWDFNVYYSAAHAFAAGGNPYTPIHPHPGLNGDLVFQYPPLTLYLFRWTSFFSLATSKLIWLGAKLGAVALLAWFWRRDFEATDFRWPILLFIALGLNASLLRDIVCGNISTFEQLGLWFGFGFAVRQRPYAAAAVLACVAQFKLMPVVFLALIPLMRPRDGWKPFLVGCTLFLGLLILNQLWSPQLTGDYLGLFSNANLRMDDRGANNPSSLAWFRDLIDLTSYAPGLPYNRASGTLAYGVFLVALTLIMIRAGWNRRASLRRVDRRLLVYLGCALFTVAAPRMKDYSYILMLIPTLFVVRDLNRRAVRTDYLLLAVGLMIVAQPQQSNVPGVTDLVYMLQSYLPLYLAGGVLVYLVGALRDPETDLVVDNVACQMAVPSVFSERSDVPIVDSKAVLTFGDGIRVVVPDSLNLITTYVLREQGDWFEDEIKFVRRLLAPNQKAIDIGANYGLFTLSMAKIVGPGGRIWAFEPASSTAAFLSESLRINGFGHVMLDQRALSDHAGSAQLSLHDHSELNELVREGASVGASETVTLISLDDATQAHGWSRIEFVKIDAEGEEAAIIRGGRHFFESESPLIQYEVKAANAVHLELVQTFADIGYASYRLVPGLGVLVPFDVAEPVDGYLLNLFCCKPDRAAMLAGQGRIVLADDVRAAAHTRRIEERLQSRDGAEAYGWQNTLARLPYGRILAGHWRQTVGRGYSGQVEKALALHAMAHDEALPMTERYLALRTSLDTLTAVCHDKPHFLRLASLARVAREFGARAVAVDALDQLLMLAAQDRQVNPGEPFLATGERFDALDPKAAAADWVVCSVLEELERNAAFSSFYSGQGSLRRLETIRNLGFGSPEMARRLALVNQRFSGTTS